MLDISTVRPGPRTRNVEESISNPRLKQSRFGCVSSDRLSEMPAQPARASRGFTLLEVLLVLAIIAVVAAIAVPTLETFAVARQLDQSADELNNAIRNARVTAMRTGQVQALRLTIGGNEYQVSPWQSVDDATNAAAGAVLQSSDGTAVQVGSGGRADAAPVKQPTTETLGESVMIEHVNTASDTRTQYQQMLGGGDSTGQTGMVLFYSDGTSSTAEIVLQDESGRQQALQVRGLTGRCQIIEL